MLVLLFCIVGIYGTNARIVEGPEHIKQKEDSTSYEIIKKGYELGIASFTANLTKMLSKELQMNNILISPLNIYNALGLLHLGARQITQEELSYALGLPSEGDLSKAIQITLGNILKLVQNSTNVSVNVASGVFVSEAMQLRKTYTERALSVYGTEPKNVDFTQSNTTDYINSWISSETKGRIPKLFDSSIDPSTQLLLATALYFSGNWSNRFPKSQTQPDKFRCHSNEYNVQLMSDNKTVPYYNNPEVGYHAIALPFEGDEVFMYMLLPYEPLHITDIVDKLGGEDLVTLFTKALNNRTYVNYKIPRMKFTFKHDLNEEIMGLGVKEIFGNPNFKGMVQGSVKVSNIKHVSEIEMDEDGCTGSAATVIGFLRSALAYLGEPVPFKVDKPFSFYIYDTITKSIIFNGVVHNPE